MCCSASGPKRCVLPWPERRGILGAEVALVETVGRRRIVHFTTGGTGFLGGFDRDFEPRPGEAVGLTIDVTRAHLFDRDSEARLSAAPRGGDV